MGGTVHIVDAGLRLSVGEVALAVGGNMVTGVGGYDSVERVVDDDLDAYGGAFGQLHGKGSDVVAAMWPSTLKARVTDRVAADHDVIDVFAGA